MDTQLRDNLLSCADSSFLTIAYHATILLDAALVYGTAHPVVSRSDKLKAAELNTAIQDIGYLLKQMGFEIERWKKEERVLSVVGVELQFLNELKATIEAMSLFLIREKEPITCFNRENVNQAYIELVRCNRLLQ